MLPVLARVAAPPSHVSFSLCPCALPVRSLCAVRAAAHFPFFALPSASAVNVVRDQSLSPKRRLFSLPSLTDGRTDCRTELATAKRRFQGLSSSLSNLLSLSPSAIAVEGESRCPLLSFLARRRLPSSLSASPPRPLASVIEGRMLSRPPLLAFHATSLRSHVMSGERKRAH